MKLITIIQARLNSARFPAKVIKKYKQKTLLEILIKRLKKSKKIKDIVVATSKDTSNEVIKKLCNKLEVICYQGSEKDVIDRYYQVAKLYKSQNIIRITADCPLIDPKIIDSLINNFFQKRVDYATNTMPPTFPDGMDVEIFSINSLKQAWKSSRKNIRLREHVTTYIRENKNFKKFNLKYKKDYSFLRITIDYPEDLIVIKNILKNFKNIYNFGIDDLINLYRKKQYIFLPNIKINRNDGQYMSNGQKTWKRANELIPGGTMLFSKNPDLFLPRKWPAYFERSKGCNIWDLDGNCLKDLCYMGVGTNSLGYAHIEIEKKVYNNIKKGAMTTLNSIEEIKLAERLIELHPWFDMVRYTRSGGEANAVAIRIARAASSKDKVAICGYHGWHDWYLSSNLVNANKLNSHLMNQVPISGVPKSLKDTVFPFDYNNFDQLKKIVSQNNIGVIKMEVQRDFEPQNNFLKKVRDLATKKKIVLIFDECTSGFRQTFGGLHKYYGVKPDMAILGKALGNGYAINAILGTKAVMESCNSTFISSTFWTERIGPTAALETLNVMEKTRSWESITKKGQKIKKNWKKLSKIYGLELEIKGIDAIPNFRFISKNHLAYKTYISQEMLKKKFLASNTIYCSTAHKDDLLNKYFDILDNVFLKIKKFETNEVDYKKFLETPISISGLRENSKKD